MTLDITGFVLPVPSREVGVPPEPGDDAPDADGPDGDDPAADRDLRSFPGAASLSRRRRMLAPAAIVTLVAAFSGAWTGGALVLHGPGAALYVRLALDHFGADRTLPYWIPELWAGAPVWAVVPSFPLLLLGPLATVLGPDVGVKAAVLGFQVFGGLGAFVLARSLWGRLPASVVAGALFALQPMLVSVGALAGSPQAVAVMAVTPWVAWSLRRGLRGDGGGYVVLAGLFSGFAMLMHLDLAVGLALLGACLVAVELRRARTGRNAAGARGILARAAAVPAIAFGVAAYWLLPFLTLGRSFARTAPALTTDGSAATGLIDAGRALVARDPGLLLSRSAELTGAVSLDRPGVASALFQVGWACLALTLLTLALLPRRDRDGGLTAVLLASALGMWLSTGSVALAAGRPAGDARLAAFGIAAAAAGLLIGGVLRPLRPARAAPPIVAALVFIVAAPYLAPFDAMRAVTSFVVGVRFPQAHTVVPLGLALGAAYPVVLVHEWALRHRAGLAPALAAAVAMAVVGIFVVDTWPTRSFYRAHPPATAAYRPVASALETLPAGYRVSPGRIEPAAVAALLDTGRQVSVGWPPGVAGEQAWRLTGEPIAAPTAYRDRANGLTATGWVATEKTSGRGTAEEAVTSVDLVPNPSVLNPVRTYPTAVVLAARDITPELAVALAYRNVGVVSERGATDGVREPALAALTVADIRSTRPCADDSIGELGAALASQMAVACGLHGWLPAVSAGVDLVDVGPAAVGAVFRSPADRLRGVSVWLDGGAGRTELALHEVGDDGRSLGRELARGRAVGTDEYGLAVFTFDPIVGSVGRRYAFVLTCSDCPAGTAPRLVAGHGDAPTGNLLVDGTVRGDRSAAFVPVHDPVGVEKPSSTTVTWTRPEPGRWRVEADGAGPSLVVVAESWFPGWRATVDGVPAPVLEADGAFLGVALEPGAHVVDFEYHRPGSATAGRLVTVATIALLAVLALLRRHPKARPARPVAGPRAPLPAGSTARRRDATPTDPEWDEVVEGRLGGRGLGPGGRSPGPP